MPNSLKAVTVWTMDEGQLAEWARIHARHRWSHIIYQSLMAVAIGCWGITIGIVISNSEREWWHLALIVNAVGVVAGLGLVFLWRAAKTAGRRINELEKGRPFWINDRDLAIELLTLGQMVQEAMATLHPLDTVELHDLFYRALRSYTTSLSTTGEVRQRHYEAYVRTASSLQQRLVRILDKV